MKVVKSVSLSIESIAFIRTYQKESGFSTFSSALESILVNSKKFKKDAEKWRKMALHLQGRDDLV